MECFTGGRFQYKHDLVAVRVPHVAPVPGFIGLLLHLAMMMGSLQQGERRPEIARKVPVLDILERKAYIWLNK